MKRMLSLFLVLLLFAAAVIPIGEKASAAGTTYYVDAVNGDDAAGDGSSGSPWKTIGKAAAVAQAGDTVKIRTGVYRETVTPANSGTEGAWITFEAEEGADVTVSGADLVSGTWTAHSGSVYKINTVLNMGKWKNQVFVDGVAMNLARWPNAGLDPLEPVFLEADAGTDDSKIVDSALTQPNGYWNGAGVVAGDHYRWSVASGTVSSYTTGQLNVSMHSTFGLGVNNGHGSPYYLIGKLEALDHPGEWYYDEASGTLYLQTPDSDNPAGHSVEVKARNLAFNLDNKQYIRIKGVKLFANTLNTNNASHIEIDGIEAKYVSHYELSHIDGVHQWPLSGIQLGGSDNVLKNSIIAYSPGNLVSLAGENNRVVNNLMHDAAYGPAYTTNQAHIYITGKDHLISHNTLYNSGRGAIAGSPNNARIQYNHAYDVMKLTDDGGFIYISNTDGNGTEIHHNVFHNAYTNPPHGIVGGIYLDFGAWDFKVYRNVVSDVNTFGVFFHSYNLFTHAYNNTFYNTSKFRMKDDGGALDAYGTRVINNISYDDVRIAPGFGIVEKNNFKSGDPLFADAANGNFTLQASSGAVNAGAEIDGITDGYQGGAPDIGAFESGAPAWTAGHDFDNPPDPGFTTVNIPYHTLLVNGFFERETDTVGGWTKTHSQSAVTERSGATADVSRHAWTRGLKLGSGEDGLEQQVTGLKPNTEYELRGFIKAGASGQTIRLGVKGYGGQELYEEAASTSWSKEKIRFTTGSGNTSATVYIYKPTSGGYAYADDVTLVEVDPEAPEEPDFDDDPGDWEPGTIVVNDDETGTGLNQYEFVGSWMTGSNIYAYKGDVTFSNTTNNYYQVRFEGTQIKLYSEKGTVMGIVAVSIDGGAETLVDLYAPAEEAAGNVLVYTSPLLAPGQHTLKVRVTGTKNASSGGTWHVADRVVIVEEDSGGGPGPAVALEEDFENTSIGSMPSGWTYTTDDQVQVAQYPSGNQSLMVKETGNGTTTSAGISFDPVDGHVTAELRVLAKQTGVRGNFLTLLDSDGNTVLELLFDQDYDSTGRKNIARATSGGTWANLMQYDADVWYDIEVNVDLDEGTYSVSIDDASVAEDIPLLNASSEIAEYRFSTYRWGSGTFYVDDLRVASVPVFGELYAQDFEDVGVGNLPTGWSKTNTDNPVSVTEDANGNHRLTIQESGNGVESWAVFPLGSLQHKVGVELRVMAEQTGKAAGFLMLRDSSNNKVVEIMFDQDYDSSGRRNIARRTADGNWTGLMQYNANQWYEVYVEVDLDQGTYGVFIDDVTVAQDIPVLTSSGEVSVYQFAPHRWDAGTYHIDDLRILGMND